MNFLFMNRYVEQVILFVKSTVEQFLALIQLTI